MPLIDLSAKELLSFQGRTPRPADFDAFWEEGIACVEAMVDAPRLQPVELGVPGVSCFDLTFTGVGRPRL